MKQGVEHFTSPAIDQGTSCHGNSCHGNGCHGNVCFYVEIRPGKLSTIEIFRGNQALGISIVGGVNSYQVINIQLIN